MVSPRAVWWILGGLTLLPTHARQVSPCPTATNAVRIYETIGDTGSAPSRLLQGPKTALCGPRDIAIDAEGRLYVLSNGVVTVHDPGSAGDAAPRRIIDLPKGGRNGALGLAVDRGANIYVTTDEPGPPDLGSITVYGRGTGGDGTPLQMLVGSRTGLNEPRVIAVDGDRRIYAVAPGDSVLIFARGATGDVAPAGVISGPGTRLRAPAGLAVDRRGFLYVSNSKANSVTVYPPGAVGDAAPVRTIQSSDKPFPLYRPSILTLDAHDTLYVLGGTGVSVFPPGASGDLTPVRTFEVEDARGLAVGRDGIAYVAQRERVAVFAAGAADSAAPIRTIVADKSRRAPQGLAIGAGDSLFVSYPWDTKIVVYPPGGGPAIRTLDGPGSLLSSPGGLAVDRQGSLYVTNGPQRPGRGAVRVYSPMPRADPMRHIAGPATRLDSPSDVAFGSRGEMYVANSDWQGAGWITVYRPGADGNATPIRALSGPNTLLRRPNRLAIGPGDTLYALNLFGGRRSTPPYSTVTVYAPGAAGDVEPVRSIVLAAGGRSPSARASLLRPTGLAVDGRGSVYVASGWPPSVVVFPPGATGETRPARLLGEGRGGLVRPRGVALGPRGHLYVADMGEVPNNPLRSLEP